MKMTFYSHANKANFYIKGFAVSLVLKMKVFGTRKASYLGVVFSSTVRFRSHVAPSLSPDP